MNVPRIDVGCALQRKTYVPFVSVTVQLTMPVNAIPESSLTPGPDSANEWNSDWSLTLIVYVPGLSLVTAAPPAVRSEIVSPGPTEAVRVVL